VREMRGRIKEDDSGVPTPDGAYAYLWKYREGGQHELIGRFAARRRRGSARARRRRARRDLGIFRFWRDAPFARPSPGGLERRPARLGILHHPGARLAERRGSAG